VRCYQAASSVVVCLHLLNVVAAYWGFGVYSAHSTGRIEELLQEDLEVKRRREQCQKQAAALSKLTRQLSMQEAHASSSPPGFSDSGKILI
jgi:Tfp pilus assembly protein PilO